MVDHACHRPSTTVLRIYPQKEQLGIFFMALQKLILGPNQKQMGLTLGVYIYIIVQMAILCHCSWQFSWLILPHIAIE
jgi:hypothetical protein